MSDQEINAMLVERYAGMENPWGRCKRHAYAQFKRASWKWIIFSAVFIKRFIDIIFSSIALCCLAPLFAVVAILIKLEDGGPVFFPQRRVGKWGREFKMWKFRSMCM